LLSGVTGLTDKSFGGNSGDGGGRGAKGS